MIRVSLSEAEKSIDTIWLWYQKAATALRDRLLAEQLAGAPLPRPVFLGMGPDEVAEFFLELDYVTILDLLSATEAAIRVDFWTRVQQKDKDPLSRVFRDLAKQYDEKISLEDHILEAWTKQKPHTKSPTGDFKGALRLRNWLAHGRYWTPKLARKNYSAADTFDICARLLIVLSLK